MIAEAGVTMAWTTAYIGSVVEVGGTVSGAGIVSGMYSSFAAYAAAEALGLVGKTGAIVCNYQSESYAMTQESM
jgi:hypothetical protein